MQTQEYRNFDVATLNVCDLTVKFSISYLVSPNPSLFGKESELLVIISRRVNQETLHNSVRKHRVPTPWRGKDWSSCERREDALLTDVC